MSKNVFIAVQKREEKATSCCDHWLNDEKLQPATLCLDITTIATEFAPIFCFKLKFIYN